MTTSSTIDCISAHLSAVVWEIWDKTNSDFDSEFVAKMDYRLYAIGKTALIIKKGKCKKCKALAIWGCVRVWWA